MPRFRARCAAFARSALERLEPDRAQRHSLLEPGNLLIVQERERLLRRVLRDNGIETLDGVRGFDAGCAGGYNLRWLVQWGGRPGDQAAIDLDAGAVTFCRERSPGSRVHLGSADAIPEPGSSFDLTLAFTLFSSVHDQVVARQIGAELLRITRPGGLIIIYDIRRPSPANPAVHPIARTDIQQWFPGCQLRAHSLTVIPPLARLLGRYSPALYGIAAAMPFLRSHHLYVLRTPITAAGSANQNDRGEWRRLADAPGRERPMPP